MCVLMYVIKIIVVSPSFFVVISFCPFGYGTFGTLYKSHLCDSDEVLVILATDEWIDLSNLFCIWMIALNLNLSSDHCNNNSCNYINHYTVILTSDRFLIVMSFVMYINNVKFSNLNKSLFYLYILLM